MNETNGRDNNTVTGNRKFKITIAILLAIVAAITIISLVLKYCNNTPALPYELHWGDSSAQLKAKVPLLNDPLQSDDDQTINYSSTATVADILDYLDLSQHEAVLLMYNMGTDDRLNKVMISFMYSIDDSEKVALDVINHYDQMFHQEAEVNTIEYDGYNLPSGTWIKGNTKVYAHNLGEMMVISISKIK